jgi:hypothetical protein
MEAKMQLASTVPVVIATLKRFAWVNKTCLLSLFFLSASGECSTIDRAKWREEVQLANGELVIIERNDSRYAGGFPVSRRGALIEQMIVFPDGRIVWKGDGARVPVAIELRNGKAYVAVAVQSRELCKKYGNPPASLIFFRYDSPEWVTVAESDYPPGGRINLITDPWGRDASGDARGLLKNKDKAARGYNSHTNAALADPKIRDSIDACQMLKKN